MKYRSFATLAALFAVMTVTGSLTTSASAKNDPTSHAATAKAVVVPANSQLYAQTANFGELRPGTHLEARSTSVVSDTALQAVAETDEGHAPLNLLALVVAGVAVMGSLAFRRSPNK